MQPPSPPLSLAPWLAYSGILSGEVGNNNFKATGRNGPDDVCLHLSPLEINQVVLRLTSSPGSIATTYTVEVVSLHTLRLVIKTRFSTTPKL